jgi:hypothetical protein
MTSGAVSNHLLVAAHDSPSASEVREMIARRAYELYKHRGAEVGDELSDWLKAEGEVVTMLMAEPMEQVEMEMTKVRTANRKSDSSRTAKSVNGARQRPTRRPKRNITLNGNPA